MEYPQYDDGSGARILAQALFREMMMDGRDEKFVIGVATEMLDLMARRLRKIREAAE